VNASLESVAPAAGDHAAPAEARRRNNLKTVLSCSGRPGLGRLSPWFCGFSVLYSSCICNWPGSSWPGSFFIPFAATFFFSRSPSCGWRPISCGWRSRRPRWRSLRRRFFSAGAFFADARRPPALHFGCRRPDCPRLCGVSLAFPCFRGSRRPRLPAGRGHKIPPLSSFSPRAKTAKKGRGTGYRKSRQADRD